MIFLQENSNKAKNYFAILAKSIYFVRSIWLIKFILIMLMKLSIFLVKFSTMRLSESQIEIINHLAKKYFGPMATVYLFGSRTDENKKGGDIDLFISNDNEDILTIEAKVRFLAELKKNIGERKIDVVFDNANCREKKNFYRSIAEHRVKL